MLTGHEARRGSAAPVPLTVQRAVRVGGELVTDPVRLLRDNNGLDELLSATGEQVLIWALKGRADLVATDAVGLLLEAERIAAMIDLVQSIVRTGILGRKTLTQLGMDYTGSNDAGNRTALAVNVLDNRGGRHDVRDMVDRSLTVPKNGSFSVAMERPVSDDMIVEQMEEDMALRPPAVLSAEERRTIREQAKGDSTLERLLTEHAIEAKRGDTRPATLARNQNIFDQRVQNTMMAIVPRPDRSIAYMSPGYGGYESSVPSDRIPPGPGGFTTLVFPKWFEAFAPLMLRGIDWPQGVDVQFVGDRKITAHYRAKDVDWPITVDAPDYASEVAAQLEEFQYLATHILKTSTA